MIRDDPEERLIFVRPQALPEIEFLVAYGSLQPWHVFHERYAVCACRTAAAGWRYRGKQHDLEDGSIMLLEPGETHRNTAVHKRSDFKVLFIAPELLRSVARELDVPGVPHFRLAQTGNTRLFATLQRLCASCGGGGTPLEQQSLLVACARLLLGYGEKAPSALGSGGLHQAVERARAFLHARFDEAVTLDELARAAGVSPFHLVRAFALHVGLPPHAYQTHVRIERARSLLRQGMLPVHVAAHVGFADQSHFTRHFRRIMRVTPSDYVKGRGSARAGSCPEDRLELQRPRGLEAEQGGFDPPADGEHLE